MVDVHRPASVFSSEIDSRSFRGWLDWGRRGIRILSSKSPMTAILGSTMNSIKPVIELGCNFVGQPKWNSSQVSYRFEIRLLAYCFYHIAGYKAALVPFRGHPVGRTPRGASPSSAGAAAKVCSDELRHNSGAPTREFLTCPHFWM